MPEVKTRYGTMTVSDIKQDVIGRFLQHYGEWAWDEVCFVGSVIADGARVLDVGGFVGTFSLGLAAQRELGMLCVVEANPATAPVLERNMRRNARVPHVVIEAMVGAPGAEPHAGYADQANVGSSSFSANAEGSVRVEPPAAATTLAELRAEHGPFDLIKLDVEGMELDILRDEGEYLSQGGCTLWIECNESRQSLAVAELLLSWGLEVFYFAFPSHNPDNLRGAEAPIFPFAFEAGLLAAPRTRPELSETLRNHGCILTPIWSGEDLRRAMWRTPRWGMAEWHGQDAAGIAALAGHVLRDEHLETYLEPDWQPGQPIWDRINTLDQAFRAAETMAIDRLKALDAAEVTRQALEAQLASTAALAVERLEALDAAQALRQAQEAELARLAGLRAELEAERLATQQAAMALREERQQRIRADEYVAAASAAALDQQTMIGAERKAMAAREAEVVVLKSEIHRLEERLREQAHALAVLQASTDAMSNSTVWRLTGPVRRAAITHPKLHRLVKGGGRKFLVLLRRRPRT